MQTIPYRLWSPPQSILRIEFPPSLLSSISPEIDHNGLLYGWCHGPEARLLAARAWADECPLPDPERERDPYLANLDPLGIFVYRCRGEVFLTEADLDLFERRNVQVALVIAGDRAGFFLKDADGSFCTIRSYEEFPMAPENPVGWTVRTMHPRTRTPVRRRRPPAPWSWAAAFVTAALVIPLAGLAYFTPLLPAPTIALAVNEREGQLISRWNARAIPSGSQIEIADGHERAILPLAQGQSSATYRVRDGDLEVSINTSRGSETTRYVTRPRQESGDPATADALAEIAKLEAQLKQLREAADVGSAKIRDLNGQFARLTAR